MTKNVGTTDKIIRLLLVIVIIVLYATKVISGVAAIILGIIALALLVTSIIGYCGLYSLLKVSTNKQAKPKEPEKTDKPQ